MEKLKIFFQHVKLDLTSQPANEQANLDLFFGKTRLIISWVLCAIIFLFFYIYLLPHQGFDFTDHGFYLYNSWATTNFVFSNFANLFNALLMKLGITNYLAFMRANLILLVLAVVIFSLAIEKKILLSPYLPLAILFVLADLMTFMFTYQVAPIILMLLGLGILFFAISNNKPIWRYIFFALAAFFIIWALFSNISLIPAAFILGIFFIFYLKDKSNANIFHIVYWLFLILLLSIVVYYYLCSGMFHGYGKGHGVLLSIKKLPLILWILLRYIFIVVAAIVSTYIFYYIAASFYPKLREICRARTIAFFVGFFIIAKYANLFGYVNFNNVSLLLTHYQVASAAHLGFNGFVSILSFVIFFCFYQKEDKQYFTVLALLIIVILIIGMLSTTSNTNILLQFSSKNTSLHTYLYYSFLSKYSFALISVSFVCIAKFRWRGIEKYLLEPLIWLLLILTAFVGVSTGSFYSYRSQPAFLNNTRMHVIPFEGLYASAPRAKLMNQVMDVYQKNNCKSKLFLAYPDQPLLFYVFRRFSILDDQTWISSERTFNQDNIIDQFKKAPGWCIFVAPGFNYQPKAFFSKVNHFLAKNSTKEIVINPISKSPYPDFYPSKYEIFIR